MRSCKISLIFVVVALFDSSDLYSTGTGQTCKTPLDEDSQCVPLKNCSSMVNFINGAKKSVRGRIREILQKFVCEYADKPQDTVICCPSVAFTIDEKGDVVGPPPPPPNVSDHENLKYLPKDCGVIDDGEKIVGGETAGLYEFPWMALLIYRKDDKLIPNCGGSILNERYILTAAHCLRNKEKHLIFTGVRVGEYSLSSEEDCDVDNPKKCLPPLQHLLPERIIIHPGYDEFLRINDIALIRVTKINLEPVNAMPICLPVFEDIINAPYESGVVTGWGKTDVNRTNLADKLQKVILAKREMSLCAKAFNYLNISAHAFTRLCLGGEKGIDSCKGDSGSPFQTARHFNENNRYVQRGIVSFGHIECGLEGFPAVYTNVDYYVKWILDNIYP